MYDSAYRLKGPVTVVIRGVRGYRLRVVPAGTVFRTRSAEPDRNHMLDGTCNGDPALVFARDLDEWAEPAVAAEQEAS